MTRVFRAVAAALFLLTAPLASATTDHASSQPDILALSNSFTDQVVKNLSAGINLCQSLPAVYRADCYRQNYRATARQLNGKPDYRDAQKALKRVESALKKILRQYGDKATPPITKNGQTFKPIKPEALKPATAAFDQARREAVTILLRAGGNAAPHYQKIAAVVGSNKVLMRAALGLLRLL